MGTLASLVDLGHSGRFIHWGAVQISAANLVVIALMVLVFVLAVTVRFPKDHSR